MDLGIYLLNYPYKVIINNNYSNIVCLGFKYINHSNNYYYSISMILIFFLLHTCFRSQGRPLSVIFTQTGSHIVHSQSILPNCFLLTSTLICIISLLLLFLLHTFSWQMYGTMLSIFFNFLTIAVFPILLLVCAFLIHFYFIPNISLSAFIFTTFILFHYFIWCRTFQSLQHRCFTILLGFSSSSITIYSYFHLFQDFYWLSSLSGEWF